MNILVTGSTGRLGSAVVRDLLNHGHQVVPVDIRSSEAADFPPTRQADLRHIDQLAPLMAGVDAVCHLGNFPGFHRSGRADGFSNNVSATYNVFLAAFEAGIRKIVYASSIQVYGCFGEFRTPPQYLPMDENHPHQPRDAYALSKALGEEVAVAFARRDPKLQVFSLRFTGIQSLADARYIVARMAARPGPHAGMGSLGTFIRAEDAGRSVRLSCEIDRLGHTALNILSPHPFWPCTMEMMEPYFGGVRPPMRHHVGPDQTLITHNLAREILGFSADMPFLSDAEKEPASPELKAPGSAAA